MIYDESVRSRSANHRLPRLSLILGLLIIIVLLISACQPLQTGSAPHPTGEAVEEAMSTGDPINGEYIFAVATGCGCHFNRDLGGLAGGNDFSGDDYGTVFSANITPDEATGIGSWTDEQIVDAIRFGIRPTGDGGEEGLFGAMPRYASMSDKDVMDLVAFLHTLDPIENKVQARELSFEPEVSRPEEAPPAEAPTDPVERGLYLASITRCGRCHTPRNEDGSLDWSRPLAGAPFRDTVAPNLTPDVATGLGEWSEEEIVEFLHTGIYSDGTEAHAGMKSQVDRGLNKLTDDDALAIAAFLKSLPAIENLPEPVE